MSLSANEKKLKALQKEEKAIDDWFHNTMMVERKEKLNRKGDIEKEKIQLYKKIKVDKKDAYYCSTCSVYVEYERTMADYMHEGICFICWKVNRLKREKDFLVGASIVELEVDGDNITGLRFEKDGKKYYLYASGDVDCYDDYDADYYFKIGDDDG